MERVSKTSVCLLRGSYAKEGDVENDKVQDHGRERGEDEVAVNPWRHRQERLVLAQAVERIEHLDRDEDRQGDCRRVLGIVVGEDVTVEAGRELTDKVFAVVEVAQMVEAHQGTVGVEGEPVDVASDRCQTNVGCAVNNFYFILNDK